jgi:hypothetical protein
MRYDVYIMAMVRKQVYIDKEQDEYIKCRAIELGMTEAAVLREMIDRDVHNVRRESDEPADRLLNLMLRRKAQLPNGGSTKQFDRESLYER